KEPHTAQIPIVTTSKAVVASVNQFAIDKYLYLIAITKFQPSYFITRIRRNIEFRKHGIGILTYGRYLGEVEYAGSFSFHFLPHWNLQVIQCGDTLQFFG